MQVCIISCQADHPSRSTFASSSPLQQPLFTTYRSKRHVVGWDICLASWAQLGPSDAADDIFLGVFTGPSASSKSSDATPTMLPDDLLLSARHGAQECVPQRAQCILHVAAKMTARNGPSVDVHAGYLGAPASGACMSLASLLPPACLRSKRRYRTSGAAARRSAMPMSPELTSDIPIPNGCRLVISAAQQIQGLRTQWDPAQSQNARCNTHRASCTQAFRAQLISGIMI